MSQEIEIPSGYEDITDRKPLKDCKKKDLDGTFYNIKLKEIGHHKVYSETTTAFFADLNVEGNDSEGHWYKNDTLFPPENYRKIIKVK